MTDNEKTPVQAAIDQLRSRGVKLTFAPGAYVVNFKNGSPETAYHTDDLKDAIEHGLKMGPAPLEPPPLGPMGKGHPSKRAKMYAHNRKVAARRLKAKRIKKP